MRKKIFVTREDIKKGHRASMGWCPVALAVKRVFKDQHVDALPVAGITVGSKTYATLEKVAKFICDFDEGKPVKPFSFWLR